MQADAGGRVVGLASVHCASDVHLANVQGKETGWAKPWGSSDLAFNEIKMLLDTWPRPVMMQLKHSDSSGARSLTARAAAPSNGL